MSRWAGPVSQIGAAVVTTVGGAAVAYWIYALQAHRAVWSWPMVAAVVLLAVGLLAMCAGFFTAESSARIQRQSGGARSRNYQAGRDMTITKSGDAE